MTPKRSKHKNLIKLANGKEYMYNGRYSGTQQLVTARGGNSKGGSISIGKVCFYMPPETVGKRVNVIIKII